MNDIGIEVGQKMRSAVKAKLMELECYVDDELPDYIMVMVANKRTKSQMNEDLRLFLTTKTAVFVDWLHIVLKKLKEVHVTNPNVFKNTVKRKADDGIDVKSIKKEKKETKQKRLKKKESQKNTLEPEKSLTDDLPLNINKMSEARKIVLMQEPQESVSYNVQNRSDYTFDIPSLSEVNSSNENELRLIERQIKSVKSRLGLVVQSDSDDDFINIKAEPHELFPNESALNKKQEKDKQNEILRTISFLDSSSEGYSLENLESSRKQKEHTRIVFDLDHDRAAKKKSILERLGNRHNETEDDVDFRTGLKKSKISLSEIRKEEERILGIKRNDGNDMKQSELPTSEKKVYDKNSNKRDRTGGDRKEKIRKRLGVQSKVAVPPKKLEEPDEKEEEVLVSKEVPSVVKVKPRVIPPNTQQANKNLLLKAVAEAQRSIAQTPAVGTNAKPDALFTKNYQKKIVEKNSKRKLADREKVKLKNIIADIAKEDRSISTDDEDTEYVPKPVKKVDHRQVDYVPSSKVTLSTDESASDRQKFNQNFIVTLDGIENKKADKSSSEKKVIKLRMSENSRKRSPSPIIFDRGHERVTSVKKSVNVPDKLPLIHAPPSIKNRERCKYWPSCRHGDKCEFQHPSSPCKLFPQCKFGDKCLYIHPSCKFESSCTRRDCPYSHMPLSKGVASRIVPTSAPIAVAKQTLQTCKFFPHCNNSHCTFYHPRPCKFGKFCKNQSECNFSHTFVPKNNLTWRNDFKL